MFGQLGGDTVGDGPESGLPPIPPSIPPERLPFVGVRVVPDPDPSIEGDAEVT